MGGAVVWWQSRALLGSVAALLLLVATHFGISLPWTRDNIIDFLLVAIPVIISIEGRITATKVIAPTVAKAEAINATTTVVSAAAAPAAPGQNIGATK